MAFRKWTWIGTVRMVRANPLLGTGIGSFPIAYGRYSETAFTNHAHNSYLQWAGEVGIPGGLLLLTGFAAATAFATSASSPLMILRTRSVGKRSMSTDRGLRLSVFMSE